MRFRAAKRSILSALAAVVLVAALCAPLAAGEPLEKLDFIIKWAFLEAGFSTMQIEDAGEGKLLLSVTTVSSPFLSTFYKVKDRMESLVRDTDSMLPYYYHLSLREGKHRKERRVTYLHEDGLIVLNNIKDGKVKEYDVAGEINDMISAFYRVRGLELKVGQTQVVKVFDNGKIYDVYVEVLRKEKIKVPAGTFETVVIKPVLKSEGIFVRKGSMLIWLTDDERHMPVRVRSRVKVGSVSISLLNATSATGSAAGTSASATGTPMSATGANANAPDVTSVANSPVR